MFTLCCAILLENLALYSVPVCLHRVGSPAHSITIRLFSGPHTETPFPLANVFANIVNH